MANYGRDKLEKASELLLGVVVGTLASGVVLIKKSLNNKANHSATKNSNDNYENKGGKIQRKRR